MYTRRSVVAVVTLCSLVVAAWLLPNAMASEGAREPARPLAEMVLGPDRVDWRTLADYESLVLTVAGPERFHIRQELEAGQTPSFGLIQPNGERLSDGTYMYELRAAYRLDSEVRERLLGARESGDDAVVAEELRKAGKLRGNTLQWGSFSILDGNFVAAEPVASNAVGNLESSSQRQLRKITADVVQGPTCIGSACLPGDEGVPLNLKDGVVHLDFEDSSAVPGFPSNDWRLTANDSASGGANKFSIEDITGANIPFTVMAGAASNSIFVDSTGRVGFRTSTPVLDLHVNTGNTPAIRLEQNGSGGFTAQTWDMAGNEANFFVRDVTGGSRLPFRIRPGAPTSSIDISAAGNVGLGTASPNRKLHVITTSATDNVLVEVQNNGPAQVRYTNATSGETWNTGHQNPSGNGFIISDTGDTTAEMLLDQSGNVTFLGTVTSSSSRMVKDQLSPVDPHEMLRRVVNLPITTWSYKTTPGVRHVGPMSEDFFATFSVGADDKGISVTDSAGVAFAAIQGLYGELAARDAEIAALRARLEEISERLEYREAAPGSRP